MGYGDAKVVVQVTEREDKALEHAGPNGTTTYYPKGGLIRLEALELQVCQQLEEPGDGETHPTLKTRVYGEARLKDCDLSIIGEPENKTRNLKITIQAGELSPAALEADRLEVASEPGRFVSQPMGAAQLGFIRSDRESVRPDQWWLMCSVPVACLQALGEGVTTGQLRSVNLGLRLKDLYTDDHPWAPFAPEERYFLRPNRRDNTIDSPEATGFVIALNMSLARVDMRPAKLEATEETHEDLQMEVDDDTKADSTVKEMPPDPVAVAIGSLTANLAALRTTLKWLGVVVAMCLVILALK